MSFKQKFKRWLTVTLSVMGLNHAFTNSVMAGTQPYIGDVMLFAGTFCPAGWTEASGGLLAISSHEALFSLYGTTYGGDGRTTFGIPDLRGRIPVGEGQGIGLGYRSLGSMGGTESVTMTTKTLAGHSHVATTSSTLHASSQVGTTSDPENNVLADDDGENIYITGVAPDASLNALAVVSTTTVASAGNGSSFTTTGLQPFLGMRYCIALLGFYPARN